ncbi:glycosyltransferase [Chungangia koreensis]|uniref:Glycosyltransferase n=1 Tax=Chungangia koreensis TaxID=752657 RepID=A0ABV8X216_9LACT
MVLFITLFLFTVFAFFQTLYIFVPLYTSKKKVKLYPRKEKGFSILIPMFNEMLVVENCLKGIFNLQYKNVEVLFINDGSTDDTFETLCNHLNLVKSDRPINGTLTQARIADIYRSEIYPNIWVINKENGGKADSLNVGIDYAQNELIVTLDADCILEPNSINEMNRTFSDENIIAAGGLVNIVQGFTYDGSKFIPHFKTPNLISFQVVRYLTGFYMNKITQAKLGSLTVISGAFGTFRREILILASGYRQTVGEDMDITLRIQELIGTVLKGKRVTFVPEAICYTECPTTLKNLFKQRIRWQKAFVDCIITYRKSFYRKMNFSVSTFILIDSLLLGTLSAYPILFIPMILLLSLNHIKLFILLFAISGSLAMLLNFATVIVSKRYGHVYGVKDSFLLLLFLPMEVMFFRITEVIFVTFGTIIYFFNRHGWSRSERIGKPIMIQNQINVHIRDPFGG